MEKLARARLAAFAAIAPDNARAPALGSADSYVTLYAGDVPALTVTRPRVIGRNRLFTVNAIDGTLIHSSPFMPTMGRLVSLARRASKTAPELAPAERAEVNAAAMRASVPALRASARSLARRIEAAPTCPRLAEMFEIVAHTIELKESAIRPELAAAFALPNPRPASYGPALGRVAWAAVVAALAFTSPASAEIAATHFHAAPDTIADFENNAAELVAAVTDGCLFVALVAVALAGPVAVALMSFFAGRR